MRGRAMRWMVLGFTLALAGAAGQAAAEPPADHPLFDSWSDSGCGVYNVAFIDIAAPTHLSRMQLKWRWDDGEADAPFTVTTSDDEKLGEGALTRGADCHSLKEEWCVAEGTPNLDLAPGTYKIVTERQAICQDSRGSVVRAFGHETGAKPDGNEEASR
jgi:hypothetical protein